MTTRTRFVGIASIAAASAVVGGIIVGSVAFGNDGSGDAPSGSFASSTDAPTPEPAPEPAPAPEDAESMSQEQMQETVWPVDNFPVNDSGESFGSDAGAETPAESPDLVVVQADNGLIGFVRAEALDGPEINTPEQALEYNRTTTTNPPVLPVYEADGTTRIGSFTMSIATGEE